MSYKTKFGQSILDIMLQNKGSITGLTEFYKDLDSLTDTVEDIKEVSINKVSNPVTRFYDSKRLTVSASKFVPEPVIAPNAPVLEPLTVLSDSEITANWDAQVVDFYTVEFDTINTFDSPNFTTENTTNTTLTKTGLTQKTEYFVRVKAVNAGGESPYSNIESATTESLPFTFTVKSDNSGISNNDEFTFPQRSGTSPNYVIRQQGVTGNEVTVTSDTDPTTITFIGGAGTYTVEMEGTDIQPHFNNGGDKDKMLPIIQSGNLIIGSESFQGCGNLDWIANDLPTITSLVRAFDRCSSFVANNSVSNWDVSNINSLAFTFSFTPFNQNISSWNTLNILSVAGLFYGNSLFNQDISSWDLSNCTEFSQVFRDATAFNQPVWSSVSPTGSLSRSFFDTDNFNQPINWNFSNVTDMQFFLSQQFPISSTFNQDVSSWNVSNVTNFNSLFKDLSLFNQSLSNWNLSSATNLLQMLNNCGMSTENYNLTLHGWVNGGWTIPTGLTLGAASLVADTTSGGVNGITARNTFINTYGWTIIDATP